MNKRTKLVATAAVALAAIVVAATWWQGRQEAERKRLEKLVLTAQAAAKAGTAGASACGAVLAPLTAALESSAPFPEAGPEAERGWRAVGDCAMQLRRWPEAVSAYRRIVTAQPQQSRAHADLARALSKTGQHGEAVQTARLSVQLAPEVWQSHRVLGTTLAAAGQTEAAITAIETARNLAPTDQRDAAEKYLTELRTRLTATATGAAPVSAVPGQGARQ